MMCETKLIPFNKATVEQIIEALCEKWAGREISTDTLITAVEAVVNPQEKDKNELCIHCCDCRKEILASEAHPAFNHPEAPPVCFDCLPDEAKEILEKQRKEDG